MTGKKCSLSVHHHFLSADNSNYMTHRYLLIASFITLFSPHFISYLLLTRPRVTHKRRSCGELVHTHLLPESWRVLPFDRRITTVQVIISKHRCFYNATWSTSSYLHVWACFYEARLLYITTMYMYHVLLYACVRFVHTRRLCHVHQFAYCNTCRTQRPIAYRVMHDADDYQWVCALCI